MWPLVTGFVDSNPAGAWMTVSCQCFELLQVEASATGRSLVQRSPTESESVSLCVMTCNNNHLHLKWVDIKRVNYERKLMTYLLQIFKCARFEAVIAVLLSRYTVSIGKQWTLIRRQLGVRSHNTLNSFLNMFVFYLMTLSVTAAIVPNDGKIVKMN